MHHEWAKVLDTIEGARKRIGCVNSGAYYRGHSRSDYRLLPTLLRANLNSEDERNLYAESFVHAHTDLRDCRSSWEVLSILQHYGIPTRLLDWTESFAVAVFFAVASNSTSPTIWILNAFRMTGASTGRNKPFIFTVGIDSLPDYRECFVDQDKKWPYERPVFLEIPWNSRRVASQRGHFTFHPDAASFEENSSKYLQRIEIPVPAVKAAMRFLEMSGVHEHSIFPDLAGLGMFLRNKYVL